MINDTSATSFTSFEFLMSSSSRESKNEWANDISKSIEHIRISSQLSLFDFVLAINLWCIETEVSRIQYSALREILRMLELNTQLSDLFNVLATLKKQTKDQLSLLRMRKNNISLNLAKLSAHFKKIQIQHHNSFSSVSRENLYFFEFQHLLRSYLFCSDIRTQLYFEMTQFRDDSCEYWHSRAWASSVRTTSRQYAHSTTIEQSFFSSNFVVFACDISECVCHELESNMHVERIVEVKLNYRDCTSKIESITLKVQKAFEYKNDATFFMNSSMLRNEMILINDFCFISESTAKHETRDIHMNYVFQNRCSSQEDSSMNKLIVRRFFDEEFHIRFLCQSHFLRVELELRKFTREHFVFNFDNQTSSCLSLSLTLFIDEFELYKNSYRSLMRIYLIIAAFFVKKRSRMFNVLPLTLDSHDSNMKDVVTSFQSLFQLNSRTWLKVDEQDRFVCAFALCYLIDMSQQAKNADVKTQRNNMSCRFCLVLTEERHNLNYDIVANDRFHHEIHRIRRVMNAQITKIAQKTLSIEYELNSSESKSSLKRLSFALDLILSRSSDLAHVEYENMIKQLHAFLLKDILNDKDRHLYITQLQQILSSIDWNRLQSSLHHLRSYILFEHARWSIIAPSLLRCWLKLEHIQSYYLQEVKRVFVDDVQEHDLINIIVSCFATNVKCNSLLMSAIISRQNRQNFSIIIHRSRTLYRRLCEVAAVSVILNSRSRQSTSQSAASQRQEKKATKKLKIATKLDSSLQKAQFSTQQTFDDVTLTKKKDTIFLKAKIFKSLKTRSNLHIAMHYKNLLTEYVVFSNCSVLIEEQKHRYEVKSRTRLMQEEERLIYYLLKWYKKIIYDINHRNVEWALLKRENIKQTLRLLLLQVFASSKSKIIDTVQRIANACLSLLNALFFIFLQLDNVEDENSMNIIENKVHRCATTQDFLSIKHCTKHNLSLRIDKANDIFKRQLSQAYFENYDMINVYHFDHANIKWCKKFTYIDKLMIYSHFKNAWYELTFLNFNVLKIRCTFCRENFVKYHESRVDQIQQMFVHDILSKKRHMFAMIKRMIQEHRRNHVLDLSLLRFDVNTEIIELSRISEEKLYMLSITLKKNNEKRVQLEDDENILFVDWSIIIV